MVNGPKEQEVMKYIKKEVEKFLYPLGLRIIRKQSKSDNFDLYMKTKGGKAILMEIKSSGEPSYIYKAISQLKYNRSGKNGYLMVAVPKISEKSKEICRNSGVGYIDLVGNVFVKYDNVLIDKAENKKLPRSILSDKKRVKDLFSGNALRILIAILNNPKNFTQEELSESLNLSKGYVNRILKTFEEGIREEGEILIMEGPNDKNSIKNHPGVQVIGSFDWVSSKSNRKSKPATLRKTKKYKVDNPQKLLDLLVKNYSFNENKILSFYSFEKDIKKLMGKISGLAKENKLDYAFTLHAGASLLAPFVRFEDVYFYVRDEDVNRWADLLGLKRTEFGGNVFLVVPKYKWILDDKKTINKRNTVNEILLYLDLINYPKRGKEQADFLRNKKIGY